MNPTFNLNDLNGQQSKYSSNPHQEQIPNLTFTLVSIYTQNPQPQPQSLKLYKLLNQDSI
jgi:hypothetical protein